MQCFLFDFAWARSCLLYPTLYSEIGRPFIVLSYWQWESYIMRLMTVVHYIFLELSKTHNVHFICAVERTMVAVYSALPLAMEIVHHEVNEICVSLIEMSRLVGKPTMWFPNRSDTNRPVQLQKQARSFKLWS